MKILYLPLNKEPYEMIERGRPEWGAPDYKTFIIKLGKRLDNES